MFTFKKLSFVISICLVLPILCLADDVFEDTQAKQSYSVGLNIGSDLKENLPDLNVEQLLNGLRDAYTDSEWKLSEEDYTQVLDAFQQEQHAKQMQRQQQLALENRQAGMEFLEENKTKDGVKVTSSGLQYLVIEEGTGESPGASDRVQVHYRGKTIDGDEFDSSYTRGEPVVFGVDQVIPGWTEAIQLMKEGANYQVYIPSELGYGAQGAGNVIGPNETLIFDIELLKVNP
jgi:FKBP-type peptidyl-prolyl cis-trans isomerase FklB